MALTASLPRDADELVAAFDAARAAYAVYDPPVNPPSPCVVICCDAEGFVVRDWLSGEMLCMWIEEREARESAMYAARGDLYEHVADFGPVETATGVYKIDGDGYLAFRRGPHIPFDSRPSAN